MGDPWTTSTAALHPPVQRAPLGSLPPMRLALTKRSGDAIRILLHLASMPAGTRQTSAELAEASGVSQGNIPTLVAALSRAGLLD